MKRRHAIRTVAIVAVVALVVGGGVWALVASDAIGELTGGPPEGPAEKGALPEEQAPEVRLELSKIAGVGVGRVRVRRLRKPARAIRDELSRFVTTAFVDPDGWAGGRFPNLERFFAADARGRARRDVADLTLGRVASRLDSVDPERARVHLRFLVGPGGGPAAAQATVDFRGVGEGGGDRIPVRHRGEYVLQRGKAGWKIVSYDARTRVPIPNPKKGTREASFAPSLSGKPTFFLVIGSDARPRQPVARHLADSLHIVGVNPAKDRASVLGIPRDSYVSIPGVGTRKINESLFYGGPQRTVETVERLTGIRIDGYLLTGFLDFRRLVGQVGGVEVRVPYPMSDRNSGAHFSRGTKRMRGRDALAFSRNRYDAPGGDFGRSMNQGRFMIAALREFQKDLDKGPVTLFRWLVAGMRSVQTDIGLADAVDLLLAATRIDPGQVKNRVVSGSGAMVGGASVVRLGSGAQAMFRDLRRDGLLGGR